MVTQTEAVSSKQIVSFSILSNFLSRMRNSLFYTYPSQSVRCDRKRSFVESNHLLAVNDSETLRHQTQCRNVLGPKCLRSEVSVYHQFANWST